MAQRGSIVARHVRTLGWRSPETLAVLVASFVVTLAAIYVGAYARVAADGVDEAHLTQSSRAADQQKDALLARISELSLASDVQKTATVMNMTPNDPSSEKLLNDSLPVPVTTDSSAPLALAKTQP